MVGTVGALKVEPGVINAVPGRTELLVDIRSTSALSKKQVSLLIKKSAKQIAHQRSVRVEVLTIPRRKSGAA